MKAELAVSAVEGKVRAEAAILAARKRIRAMDEIDRKAGHATPFQCGRREVLSTTGAALAAAIASLKNGNIKTAVECAADALVMLEGLDQ
jgi:hypothetical protein